MVQPRRCLAGAVALLWGTIAPACAHAILVASLPVSGGHTVPGALEITLRFNSLIDIRRSRLALIGTDGREVRLSITSGGVGDTMLAHTPVAPGANMLRWQVLALDGHITRGNVPFEVTVAPPREPAPAAR